MDSHDTADQLEKLIVEAFDSVPQDYYRLKTTYEENGIVRERVFCYELYHRMRCLQVTSELTDLNIHGEIDKRGHDLFEEEDQNNPDFVFHIPGSMEHNLIVIEVKGSLNLNGVNKDWKTLDKFCHGYQYGRGLWLVYNYSFLEIANFIQRHPIGYKLKCHNKLQLFCKKNADSEIEKCEFSELSDTLKAE